VWTNYFLFVTWLRLDIKCIWGDNYIIFLGYHQCCDQVQGWSNMLHHLYLDIHNNLLLWTLLIYFKQQNFWHILFSKALWLVNHVFHFMVPPSIVQLRLTIINLQTWIAIQAWKKLSRGKIKGEEEVSRSSFTRFHDARSHDVLPNLCVTSCDLVKLLLETLVCYIVSLIGVLHICSLHILVRCWLGCWKWVVGKTMCFLCIISMGAVIFGKSHKNGLVLASQDDWSWKLA